MCKVNQLKMRALMTAAETTVRLNARCKMMDHMILTRGAFQMLETAIEMEFLALPSVAIAGDFTEWTLDR